MSEIPITGAGEHLPDTMDGANLTWPEVVHILAEDRPPHQRTRHDEALAAGVQSLLDGHKQDLIDDSDWDKRVTSAKRRLPNDQTGFITMILLLLLLVIGAIALVFWRVISAG